MVVPYSFDESLNHLGGVQPETRAAVPYARFIEVRNPTGYHDLLEHLWDEGRGFVLVEQDIVPWPGAVEQLWKCPELYCAFPYAMRNSYAYALGCTKFSRELVREFPEMVRLAALVTQDGLPARDWRRLDTRVEQTLKHNGYAVHVHQPHVGHLNPAQEIP